MINFYQKYANSESFDRISIRIHANKILEEFWKKITTIVLSVLRRQRNSSRILIEIRILSEFWWEKKTTSAFMLGKFTELWSQIHQ